MSSAEIDQIVAQRVTEAIVVYETKIRMAHDSMNQVVRQGTTVARNANNKRKWGSDHGRNSGQQQNKRRGVVRAHTSRPGNKKETSIHGTTQRAPMANQKPKVTYYECRKPGHYKSDCPKWKNQNRVNHI
ncbi:reverse transcriptase domain-containing protein [Tanacetum coccineum]